jgi:hypothetical protein
MPIRNDRPQPVSRLVTCLQSNNTSTLQDTTCHTVTGACQEAVLPVLVNAPQLVRICGRISAKAIKTKRIMVTMPLAYRFADLCDKVATKTNVSSVARAPGAFQLRHTAALITLQPLYPTPTMLAEVNQCQCST